MSLLKNLLSSAFASSRSGPHRANRTPATETGTVRDPPAEPVAGAVPGTGFVWRLLDEEAGVQDFAYPDNPRKDVHVLLGREPRRVLDVGCATGAVGLGLKQAFPGVWVWGCELSLRAAQVARGRLDHMTVQPRERWSAADLALLETVDTVMLLDVLEHMVNPWAELRFLAERLPPDAQLVVSLPNAGHWSILANLSAGSFKYEAAGILDITHLRFFTLREMRAMFEETGFEVRSETILSKTDSLHLASFPANVAAGKLTLRVETALEWQQFNAIQFGFQLVRRRDLQHS